MSRVQLTKGHISIAQKILLILGGIAAACLIAEISLRMFKPQIYELHPPGLYTADTSVGYVLKPGFRGSVTRSEFHTLVTIGQAGLRGADPRPPQQNSYRILVLGDSMAWGFGVEDNQTFSVQLEGLLTARYPDMDIQVLNGAVPGYGTADELSFLQKRGAELRPNLVIVQFFSVNDLSDNLQPASTWADVRDGMLTMQDGTENTGTTLPPWKDAKNWLKQNSHLAAFIFDRLGYLGTRTGILDSVPELWGEDFSEADSQLGTRLLVEIAQEAQELGAETLFLYTTGQAPILQPEYHPLSSLSVVQNAAAEAQVAWIDGSEQLQYRQDRLDLYYPLDGHWTAAGHRAIAEILTQKFVEMGYIPSNF